MACDPTTVLAEAGCISCLSVGQQQAMIVKLLCEILKAYDPTNAMATCDPQTILDDANCLTCLQPQQLLAMTVKLLCEIKDTVALPWLGWGTDGPVADPGVHPALFINEDNGTLWYWNLALGIWQQVITI